MLLLLLDVTKACASFLEYFSDANEYYGNNSIMAPNMDSDINHCEIIVLSRSLRYGFLLGCSIKNI